LKYLLLFTDSGIGFPHKVSTVDWNYIE